MSNHGSLSSDSQRGICICEKPYHVVEGTRTELVPYVLSACISLQSWCACGQTKQRDYPNSHVNEDRAEGFMPTRNFILTDWSDEHQPTYLFNLRVKNGYFVLTFFFFNVMPLIAQSL